MREILVCVTFRDFNGTFTDEVQKKMLKSIVSQSYQKYKLIVTLCGEKNVEKTLKEIGVKYVCYNSSSFRFTTVFSNAFPHLEKGKNIILYTHADNIFDPNFFQEIINNFIPGISGTSYPPLHYYSLEDYKKKSPNNCRDYKNRSKWVDYNDRKLIKWFGQYDPNTIIPETIFIDGDLMLNEQNSKVFLSHQPNGPAGPGNSLSLMISFYSERLINIFFKTKVHTIETSRELKQASHDSIAWGKNISILQKFMKERNIDKKFFYGTLLHTGKYLVIKEYKIIGLWYQRIIYSLYMRINTFPFKIQGLWFPQNIKILIRYALKNIFLFLARNHLLPAFLIKAIIHKSSLR